MQQHALYSAITLQIPGRSLYAATDILRGNLDVNLGSIAENVIAQELVAHGFRLHYFNGKRTGEVDFVVQSGRTCLPIEVKSGADWQRHPAINNLLATEEWGLEEGIVLCKGNVEKDGKITYLPLYMVMFLEPESLPASMPFKVDLSGL